MMHRRRDRCWWCLEMSEWRRRRRRRLLGMMLGFMLWFDWIGSAGASIREYKHESFFSQSGAYFFHGGSEGLYASSKNLPPNLDKPNAGRSFIRFENINLKRTKESAEKQNAMHSYTGLVEAIIVEVKDRERIGGSYLGSDSICCTQELSKQGHCKVGEVIIRNDADSPDWPHRIKISFEGTNEETTLSLQTVYVNNTGMYYLYFMFCDDELKGTIISGSTVWKNPNGYLPGKMAPLLTFYGVMSLAYLGLGLMWLLRFMQFWKNLTQLHYHITTVIALGMLEMAFWYFDYSSLNSAGV